MPEQERNESIKTVTGVPKGRVSVITQAFIDAGAYSVQAWEEPPASGEYTVRAVFRS